LTVVSSADNVPLVQPGSDIDEQSGPTLHPPRRSVTDRRQPQLSDQRRAAILRAFDEALRNTNFDAVSIADVAAGAGVSRSAFYFYFENKAAAVAALLESMYDDVFAASDIVTATTGSPRWRIRSMLQALMETGAAHRYLFAAMLDARAASSAIRDIWDNSREAFVPTIAAMITAERDAGRAPAGPAADVLAGVLLELNDRILERFTLGGPRSRDELIVGAETIWLHTIYGTAIGVDEMGEN
jgi:TetR/AcrR family transcriptional regulator, ethionamide resistance regulator